MQPQSIFDGAAGSLGKGKSVEDLVVDSTTCQPLRTSLSLNTVLFEYFDKGWDPNNYGLYKVEEATVLWLKGLDSMALPDVMPEVTSESLKAYQKFKASTAKLAEYEEVAAKVKDAASQTAEKKFQHILEKLLAEGTAPADAEKTLASHKKVLEKWVATRRDHVDEMLKTHEQEHNDVRDTFEK